MLPWNESYELDEAVFTRHLQETLDGGYQNAYILGTAGEGYALSEERFRHVVTVFARHMVRCLLYTSPSPRDRQKSRMPSSA